MTWHLQPQACARPRAAAEKPVHTAGPVHRTQHGSSSSDHTEDRHRGADTSARLRPGPVEWLVQREGRRGLSLQGTPGSGSQHREQTPTQGGLAGDAQGGAGLGRRPAREHRQPHGQAPRLHSWPPHTHSPEALLGALGSAPTAAVTKEDSGLRRERHDRDHDPGGGAALLMGHTQCCQGAPSLHSSPEIGRTERGCEEQRGPGVPGQ